MQILYGLFECSSDHIVNLPECTVRHYISLSIWIYNILKKSPPKPENTEWQGVWRDLGETLERWTCSVSWNFIPEHLKDPESLNRYLRQGCFSSSTSEEGQISWSLSYAYWALFSTILESESLRAERESFQETV